MNDRKTKTKLLASVMGISFSLGLSAGGDDFSNMGPIQEEVVEPIVVGGFVSIDIGQNWGPMPANTPIPQPINNASSDVHLSIEDVKQVLAQAIKQATNIGKLATFAVVDRVGNVLAVYRMNGVDTKLIISSTLPQTINTGLDGVVLPSGTDGDALAAIAKAITGAYLSSSGNAFSSRTASQIIQEHFNPGEDNQPGGPLFGVQFSQLPCSDFSLKYDPIKTVGPQRSPLGLSADSGGFPLYKKGQVVGGVGVISDNHYGLDKNIIDFDVDNDEIIALAATIGFESPVDIRANRITVDGKTLRYSDIKYTDITQAASSAQDFDAIPTITGSLITVRSYSNGFIKRGTVFADAESGVRADMLDYAGLDAFVFVDENDDERFRPKAGSDTMQLNGTTPLSEDEVREILKEALKIANKSRAQIRRPVGSLARVTIAVVDTQGHVLGMVRSKDAPIFGSDVSLQKARTAAFFSNTDAANFLNSITTPTIYFDSNLLQRAEVFIPDYVTAIKSFVGSNALSDGTAFSDRAGGNLSRPFYSDGIQNNDNGPFSKSFKNNEWSVFSTGLQLDLVLNKIIKHVVFTAVGIGADTNSVCTSTVSDRLANGIQIFPGSVPIYRGSQLIGGIGVSGDGVDQDDMVSFLGVHNAGINLNGAINNAPIDIRADNLTPQGTRLRYIQCPYSPFINSNEQNVCRGK